MNSKLNWIPFGQNCVQNFIFSQSQDEIHTRPISKIKLKDSLMSKMLPHVSQQQTLWFACTAHKHESRCCKTVHWQLNVFDVIIIKTFSDIIIKPNNYVCKHLFCTEVAGQKGTTVIFRLCALHTYNYVSHCILIYLRPILMLGTLHVPGHLAKKIEHLQNFEIAVTFDLLGGFSSFDHQNEVLDEFSI